MKVYIVFFCLQISFLIKGQEAIYPDQYTFYTNSFYLSDPSYIPESGDWNMSFSYKQRSSSGEVATLSGSLEKIFNTENKGRHLLRGFAFNEKEGPYISYPRFYLNYARELQVGKQSFLCGGVAFGLAGINFFPPSGSGSAMVKDAAIAMAFKNKYLKLGISSQQIFNSSAMVLSQSIQLHRYFNYFLQINKNIFPDLEVSINALYRDYQTMPDHLNIGPTFIYSRIFEAGCMYQYKRGLGFIGGIIFFPDVNPLYLSFGYTSPFLSKLSYHNSFEINIKYRITKNFN